MFSKVLVANRGEIAVRIFRTCRELGIETVGVHSDIDANSIHAKIADETVCIGPASPTKSYLNLKSIISAVEVTGADAIHPGYGFLSESTELSELCEKYGIAFIGPNRDAIKKMGSKINSKVIAKKLNIPILEPILFEEKFNESIFKETQALGFPVLIKASAGGGGRGMKVIYSENELRPALSKLYREALAAFGDGTLFIEKFIENPRHIEVQVLGDKFGNIVHLGNRDCSVQRRYQKVIEESPCTVISEELRDSMINDAIKISKEVKYDSAGTVEFIYDMDAKKYYFMEMNTRIQVEHPVTEERTEIDLIAEQIKVAAGQKLSIKQEDVEFRNHVMECRINAEDPMTSRPSPGKIEHYHRAGGLGVRIDDYIYSGYKIPPHYDSMISKVIVKGKNREECIVRMRRAMNEMIVSGVKTNINLLLEILDNKSFKSGDFTTNLITQILK